MLFVQEDEQCYCEDTSRNGDVRGTRRDAASASGAQGQAPSPLQLLGLCESQLECARELVALRVCLL